MAKPEIPAADKSRAASVTAIRTGKSAGAKRPVSKATAKAEKPKARPAKGSRPAPGTAPRPQPKAPVNIPPAPSEPRTTPLQEKPPQEKPAKAKRPPSKKGDQPKGAKEKTRSPATTPSETPIDSVPVAGHKKQRTKTDEKKPPKDTKLTSAADDVAPSEPTSSEPASTAADLPESSTSVAVETKPKEETPTQQEAPLAEQTRADLRWSNDETTAPSSNGSSVAMETAPDPTSSINEAPPLSVPEMPVAPPREPPASSPPGNETSATETQGDTIDQWFVQTYVGDQFGPMVKVELDDWVTQGRLTGDCHVFQEGWTEWKEARAAYPELEFVSPDDDEVELALAEGEKVDRTVSSSEPNWYTVRTGLSMISSSTIVGIVALLLLVVGFFVDRVPLSQLYFDTMHDRKIDPDHGGGLVSMVLVSWGTIGMFMSLIGVLTGVIACLAVPRKTNLHPFAMGAVGAMSLAVFTAVLMFTAAFLSLGPISKVVNVGSVLSTLLVATPWALLLSSQAAMAAIVVFACMLAEFLNQPRIARQTRWFAGLQGGLLFWVLLDAAVIPDDSDGLFTFSLFVFLAAINASLAWLAYIARSVRDAIRPS